MIIKAQLLAKKPEFGGYVIYVFQNMNYTSPMDKYVMCTRLPNWNTEIIKVGDVGFLNFKEILAGSDSWYNADTKEYIPYKYSNIYFINFIPEVQTQDLIV